MTARIGVVTFPGSLDDVDALRAIRFVGADPVRLWHAEPKLHQVDAVVLPGGFSYGDYLRCGAIARFAPVMELIVMAARDGLPVLGICNGFQILCEAHLLPGALVRNAHLHFRTKDQVLRIESTSTAWTNEYTPGQEVLIPVKNGEGRFVADRRTLDELTAESRIVARYLKGNPNGSERDIAGIRNEAGNVVGIMPHPEHAVEELTGPSTDGLGFFTSLLKYLTGVPAAPVSPASAASVPAPVSPASAASVPAPAQDASSAAQDASAAHAAPAPAAGSRGAAG